MVILAKDSVKCPLFTYQLMNNLSDLTPQKCESVRSKLSATKLSIILVINFVTVEFETHNYTVVHSKNGLRFFKDKTDATIML